MQRFRAGKLDAAHEAEIGLVNWLLENGLLDATPREAGQAEPTCVDSLKRYEQLAASLASPQRAPALADGTGEDEFVFLRGNYRTPGERAVRGPPEVLHVSTHAAAEGASATANERRIAGSGRLELALRLVDPSNPLLTRAIVNRLWQHHFGEGIVRTPDDFGRMGQPPTHPELLDHLAAELVRGDWSLKAMHRRMVHRPSAYRQASNPQSEIRQSAIGRSRKPPSCTACPIRRLEAEAIRDSILALSGRLSGTMHGPSVLPHLTPHMEGRGKPNSGPLDGDGRRSIYINARRNFLTPLLLAFDYPVTFTPIGRRGNSAIPAQALTLMNDPFVVQEAARWAERVLAEAGLRHRAADRCALSRRLCPPADGRRNRQRDRLSAAAERCATAAAPSDPRVWADLCHVLINVKEFIFVE